MTEFSPVYHLTEKERRRASNGITIIARKQYSGKHKGGYKVIAVKLDGTPFTRAGTFTEYAETKSGIGKAAKEVARWLDKMGTDCPMADASRTRGMS
jgi:hypothetical protein